MNQPVTDHASAVTVVREAIERIAPDIDASSLALDVDVRIEAELDSMDFMAVLSEINDRTGFDIPESEVARVATIDGCAEYLVEQADRSTTGT